MSTKVALVLSGGGAKGAFQVGAERYAREVKGYRWNVIAGVSVGALNGAMMAMGRHDKLLETWKALSPAKLYKRYGSKRRHAVHILGQLALRRPSLYDNEVIREVVNEIDPSKMTVDLRVGTVSLLTGEYRVFRADDPHFKYAVLASASLPLIFPPVNVGPEFPALVDGGVRKVSPIGDVLDAEPDEIIIINCSPLKPTTVVEMPAGAVAISQRSLGIAMNQIFFNDVKKFQMVNRLVAQAEAAGIKLNRENGQPYRYYRNTIIDPDDHIGETTDFSPAHVARAMEAGWEKAKKVLG